MVEMEMEKEITKEQVRRQLEHHGRWKLLNEINTSGEHTQKLLTILPQETISTILRVYRVIQFYREMVNSYDSLPKKDQFPENDWKKIRSILQKHQTEYITKNSKMVVKSRWLEKKDIEDIMNYIEQKFFRSPKGLKTLTAVGKKQIKKKKKQTKPMDASLNSAIYLLAEHLKAKTGKPNWKLIDDFLMEQGITDYSTDYFTEETIRDRYRKIQGSKIQKQYENYRNLYLFAEHNINRDMPLKARQDFYWQRIYERDITLPPWHELIP